MTATKILWGQVAVVFLIVLAAVWGATQWVAWRLGYQAQLGQPMDIWAGVPVYPPPAFFLWWYWYDAYAARKRVSQSVVVEAALESYLSADGPDRLEAALARRLDRLSRASERLERHVTIGNEAIALFVRFWITATPPLPNAMQAAAQVKGKERYDAFVEALARRLAKGRMLADEITTDVSASRAIDEVASEEKPPA